MVINRTISLLCSGTLLVASSALQLYAQQVSKAAEDPQSPNEPVGRTPRPLVPAEMPPNPPKVTCSGGQLTIVADNSTLGSILSALRSCINVTIDLPEGSSGTRIYANAGPASPYKVLESLLSSTDLDYVIQASKSNPETIQSVLLLARATDPKGSQTPPSVVLTPARRAWLATRRNAETSREAIDEQRVAEAESNIPDAAESVPPPAPQSDPAVITAKIAETGKTADTSNGGATLTSDKPPAIASTETTPASTDGAAPAASDPNGDSPAVKATQQKIVNMEQLFEQRKQMVESQSSASKPQ